MNYGCVLLADSHPPMLEGVRSLLQELFEAVVMVADEASLLRAAEQLKPELAVVDVSLPLAGRVNVVSLLRERYPELKVIALSVHDEPLVAERVISSGAAGFVLKRSAHSDLVTAVHEVLAGRTYVSPAVGMRRTVAAQ